MAQEEVYTKDPLRVGQHILSGRYTIEALLGEGGMAAIYRARDVRFDRTVVVKVLKNLDDNKDQRVLKRFAREASLAAVASHSNTVDIYDAGTIGPDKRPCIVMAYIDGHDMEEEIEVHGAMEPDRALRLFRGALEALSALHRNGIVHKDLKPANFMIQDPGMAYESLTLIDFGVAHSGGTERITEEGFCVGTPSYFPPEYIINRSVTPAMDVYQMGLLLIELLTGHHPVQGEVMDCVQIHRGGLLKQLPQLVEESEDVEWRGHMKRLMNGRLWPVISRALAFDARDRYGDATAFIRAIDSVWSPPKLSLTPAANQRAARPPRLLSGRLALGGYGATERAAQPPQHPAVNRDTMRWPEVVAFALMGVALVLFAAMMTIIWLSAPPTPTPKGASASLSATASAPVASKTDTRVPVAPPLRAPEPVLDIAPTAHKAHGHVMDALGAAESQIEASAAPKDAPEASADQGDKAAAATAGPATKVFKIFPRGARLYIDGKRQRTMTYTFDGDDTKEVSAVIRHPKCRPAKISLTRDSPAEIRVGLKPRPIRALKAQ